MRIDQISRISFQDSRDVSKDVMYLFSKILERKIDIQDEYALNILENNMDVVYHIAIILARLNVVKDHTISEIRAAISSGIPFSERDHHEDLADGRDVKRSRSMQVSKNGKYTSTSWVVANISNKKKGLIWEVTHKNRKWTANIPYSEYEGKGTLSIACDPETGEPSKRSKLHRYFEETTGI